jgi:tetratricopeptide (TPR) repeat protein
MALARLSQGGGCSSANRLSPQLSHEPLRLALPARKCQFRKARATVAALSFMDEHSFGHGPHGLKGPPARDLSEEDKQKLVERATEKIRQQTEERCNKLKSDAVKSRMDSELKFGKLMFSQGQYEAAIAHFNKVISSSGELTYHRGEATLQKAACLEKLGQKGEADAIYQSLITFRAPYPNIKRRAAQALYGSAGVGEQGKSSQYDELMYRMFLSGFGSYLPHEKYVESKEEKMVMRLVPWAVLLTAPLLLCGLFLFPH